MSTIESPGGILRKDKPLAFADPSILPGWRMLYARQERTQENILIKLSGGLGDNICAEPAVRFAVNNFHTCKISVYGENTEIMQHLDLHELWDSRKDTPDWDKYYVFESFAQNGAIDNEFIAPSYTHCVDYATIKLWRAQLPHLERCVRLVPTPEQAARALGTLNSSDVVIHPGRTWPSRTMPKWWWDAVIKLLLANGARPVLIGSEINHQTQTRGTVDVDTTGCLDLRGQTSIMETVAITQRAKVVLTNDSAPLHMAASGQAWLGFLSTVRHPEIVTHWRRALDTRDEVASFGWRMHNFAKGGLYQTFDLQPGSPETVRFDMVRASQMKSWLPEPEEVSLWAIDKLGHG